MNKNKGFIDPFSLGFIVVLGIGAIGSITDETPVDQTQLAQDSPTQTEIAVPDQEQPNT